ncbi:DMT family transporter [Synechococcus sp. LA31]|jgi:drug/metabolite transporter (DMT)-like permease|uniref:DMT family transporter n=1 Tax=Synechococcus sp. LA31 TaxID=2741953 RepID=UPI001BDC00D4|nr:DMT family transporter [Synechococcus sp. LA31]QVV68260.1 DMT family transporter [Synechococcus sp. LA31]
MLSSAISFSLMGVCVKAVGDRIPVAEVVLARSAVSLLLSVVMLRQARLNPWGKRRGLLVLRGVIGTGALLCVFAALAQLPLAAATVLQYLQPTFTALLAWLLLRERVGPRILLAALLGWMAVVVLSNPTELAGMLGPLAALLGATATPLPVAGVLLAIAGAVLSACAYVSVRALGRTEHPLVIVFYFPLVGLLLTAPLVMLQPVWPTAWEALALVGVGLFTQLGQLGVTNGLLGMPAARATALSYGQVPMAALWGWLFFGEALDPDTAMAAGLVLAATLLSLRRSRP